jgi:hypothetical protein
MQMAKKDRSAKRSTLFGKRHSLRASRWEQFARC